MKAVNAQTRASEVEWLKLNLYSGEAGEYTLQLTLLPNLTGEDRVAEIVITCGDTVIRIRVEQKGTKADGQKPDVQTKRFVNSVLNKWEDSSGDRRQRIIEFSYNSDGKLSLIASYYDFNENNILEPDEREKGFEGSSAFVYEGKTVKVHSKEMNNYYNKLTRTDAVLTLNDEGYVSESKCVCLEGKVETFFRNRYENGQIVFSNYEYSNSAYTITDKMAWKNGNLIKVLPSRPSGCYSEIIYGDEPNRPEVSIDLNFLCANTEWYDCIGEDPIIGVKIAGLVGKRSKNLKVTEKEFDFNPSEPSVYSYTYTKNAEGYVTKIEIDNNDGGDYSASDQVFIINYQK
ncbi:hypothetical protein EVA_03550 [gut metagenome]|uniref:BACON domain-containing protein n=1 Tax=gut metagenome TaxID=749906 RepID=J9GYP8_9ZZZZ